MIAARELYPPATLWLCAALAVAVHCALLFAWKMVPEESSSSAIEGGSIEVALVESAPAAPAVIAEPQPPVPPPEPAEVPPPEPPRKEPEMALPEPPKPTPRPRKPSAATPSPKTTPQTTTPRRNPTPRNSTASGTTGGANATAGTSAGGTGKTAKATYIVRPVASYPPESRWAGEQGVVILRLVVDGNGRPASVSVARGSGYPRLDRAAVEAGWRCRVRDAAPGSHLDAPVRFNLSDR